MKRWFSRPSMTQLAGNDSVCTQATGNVTITTGSGDFDDLFTDVCRLSRRWAEMMEQGVEIEHPWADLSNIVLKHAP